MANKGFTHLHLHSQYSLLDGAISFDELLKQCKKLDMDAVAVTDHGNMFGAVEFYTKAIAAHIKPIIGIEAYVAPGSRFDRTKTTIADAAYHLILLAENNTGYQNLLKLASIGYLEGFYYRPRIDKEILAEYIDHHRQDLRREGQDPERLIAGRMDTPYGAALLQRFATIVDKAGREDDG